MIGAFVSVSLFGSVRFAPRHERRPDHLGIIPVLLIAMLGSGVLNVMIERVAYRPLRNAPKLAPLITAIGMSFILQNVGLLWRPSPDSAPDLIHSQQHVFNTLGTHVVRSDLFALVVTAPLLFLLLWFVGTTKYGKAMRATAQDPDAARLMGINVDQTIALTFLLGGLLAGAAGVIYALYNLTVQFNMGFTAGLIAFTSAVMGGIGNLKGAVVGGLIIGIVQQARGVAPGQRLGVGAGRGVRDPDPDHGLQARRPLRRGDEGGMTAVDETEADDRSRARLQRPFYERMTDQLPGWAWALIFLALAILFGVSGRTRSARTSTTR